MFKITVNGSPITLNDTGGESRGGKRLVTAEVQSENGDKLYIKGYLTQNGPVRKVTEEVEVFDSKKGKVTREKKGGAPSVEDRMAKLEALLTAALAAKV